jgi:hypothetical protein
MAQSALKVQNYLTLIQRDYVTHQPATLVWYSLHKMALLCLDCGMIGPSNTPNIARITAKTRHERDTRMAAYGGVWQ